MPDRPYQLEMKDSQTKCPCDSYLYSIKVSPNVSLIEPNAFHTCDSLHTVSGASITDVGENAFARCVSLRNFDCSSLRVVGSYAFAFCPIQDVYLGNCSTIGKNAFFRDKTPNFAYLPLHITYDEIGLPFPNLLFSSLGGDKTLFANCHATVRGPVILSPIVYTSIVREINKQFNETLPLYHFDYDIAPSFLADAPIYDPHIVYEYLDAFVKSVLRKRRKFK